MKLYAKVGTSGIAHMTSIGAGVTVEGCWFKSEKIDCTTILMQHFTDRGFCFTLNAARGNALKPMLEGTGKF